MKKLVVLSFFVAMLASCTKEKQLQGDVLIRVQNQSALPAEDVKFYSETSTGGGEVERMYGNIPAGQESGYQHHSRVYVPYYSFELPGQGAIELRFMRCITGAAPLAPGKYSLIIRMDPNNQPYVDFKQD